MPGPRWRAGPQRIAGPTERVVVIGAGLGGLSAALHLAGAGRQVTVLEREARPGGRAGVITADGHRFDTGPTVLTMPELVDEALRAVGESLAGQVRLHRLDPAYEGRFADSSRISVHSDTDQMADEIAHTCGVADAAGYRELVRHLTQLFDVEMPQFIRRNLDSPTSLIGPGLLRLLRLGGFGRVSSLVGAHVQDPRLRRLFTFQSMYAGLAPAQALGLYAVISYFDCVAGVFYPDGGMHVIPQVMAAAAARHGVDIRYRTSAARIELSGDRASAVVTTDGERFAADVVVLNADPPTAYPALLPPAFLPRRFTRLRYSPSCVVLHSGGAPVGESLAHHTIFFGRHWDQAFNQVIRQGAVMSDPSFLVSYPSGTDPSSAPGGRATHYTLFPVPNLDHRHPIDWHSFAPAYQQEIITALARNGLAAIGDAPLQQFVTPADWLAAGMAGGTPFAAAHTFSQTGPFRPGTIDPRIGNLLRCGSGVQPGVGIPMVLVSGKLAADRVTG